MFPIIHYLSPTAMCRQDSLGVQSRDGGVKLLQVFQNHFSVYDLLGISTLQVHDV